jgi:hypothetical protein
MVLVERVVQILQLPVGMGVVLIIFLIFVPMVSVPQHPLTVTVSLTVVLPRDLMDVLMVLVLLVRALMLAHVLEELLDAKMVHVNRLVLQQIPPKVVGPLFDVGMVLVPKGKTHV